MNNVWTSIASRATHASQQVHRKPLLHLFNGYARCQGTRHIAARIRTDEKSVSQGSRPAAVSRLRHSSSNTTFRVSGHRTTPVLAAKRATKFSEAVPSVRSCSSLRSYATSASASGLEPAQTTASHTEGLLSPSDADAQNEALTWRDYDPSGGMPLPTRPRSQPEINTIFTTTEGTLDAETGNYVLNVMYWRRISGALIDVGLDFPRDSGVTRTQAVRALQYLRSLEPEFDEQAAGAVWAEEESERQRERLRERAVKLGLYKAEEEEPGVEESAAVASEAASEEEQQGTTYGRSRTGTSQLQQMREEEEAKYDASELERAKAEALAEQAALHTHRGPLELTGGVQPSVDLVTYTGNDGISISRPQQSAWLQPVERKEWVKHYEKHAQIINDNVIPELSLIRRLGPSALVLLLTLGGALYIAQNYTLPPRSARIWPDAPPAIATLTALTGALGTLFLLSRLPPFWRTLSKYFTLIPVSPHPLSILGCVFRHDTFSHLAINVATLWIFGLILHEDIGRGAFLSIFFASGAVGAYGSLVFHVLRRNWGAYCFGSSGCVLGVVGACCALRPTATLKLAGYEVPVAVWVWLMLWGVAEVVGAWRFRKTSTLAKGGGAGVDHIGHLGGLLAGLTGGVLIRREYRGGGVEGEMMRRGSGEEEAVEVL